MSLLAYVFILMTPLPEQIGLTARYSFLPVVILISTVVYLTNGRSQRLAASITFGLAVVLFALPLAGLWNSGLTRPFTFIGGLLPMQDAHAYYADAQRLLAGYPFSLVSSMRPLFPGLLATLLGVTGHNLQAALAILVLITAISCFLLAREVQQTHGSLPGLMTLGLLFFYYRTYIGATLTENLGLCLGAIGLAVVWHGAQRRHVNALLLGIFLLTLGLAARAGAFFVLPAIILWGAWVFRGQGRLSLRFLIGGTSAVLFGFLANSLLFKAVGTAEGMAFSNFAQVLYGQAVGGKGWTQVFRDHPELSGMNMYGAELNRRVYALALEAFLNNPSGLLIGAAKSWWDLLNIRTLGIFTFVSALGSDVPGDRLFAFAGRLVIYACCVLGIRHCYRRRDDAVHSLLLAAIAGIVISAPFVPPIDGDTRVYAATIPIIATFAGISILPGIEMLRNLIHWPSGYTEKISIGSDRVVIYFAAVLAVFVIAGPLITKSLSGVPHFSDTPCPFGREAVYVQVATGSFIRLMDDSLVKQNRLPVISISDFQEGLAAGGQEIYEGLKPLAELTGSDIVIADALDLKSNTSYYLIDPSGQVVPESGSGIRKICGSAKMIYTPVNVMPYFYAESVDKALKLKT